MLAYDARLQLTQIQIHSVPFVLCICPGLSIVNVCLTRHSYFYKSPWVYVQSATTFFPKEVTPSCNANKNDAPWP